MPVLKTGMRLKSAVCGTVAMVIKAPADDADLRCGGEPMIALDAERDASKSPAAPHDGGTQRGKRYVDEAQTIEVLVNDPGEGSLSLGEAPLEVKSAKPLPSSD